MQPPGRSISRLHQDDAYGSRPGCTTPGPGEHRSRVSRRGDGAVEDPRRAFASDARGDTIGRRQGGPMRITEMNWMHVEAYLERDDRAVVPIGSTEQHAALSLGVDVI